MVRTSYTLVAATTVLILALSAPLRAAEPATGAKDKAVGPGERIRKIFDQEITIEIKDQPLFLALNQLREQTKINFVLDRQTLQTMGQDPEAMPVNVTIKNKKVSEALKGIVKPYNLSFAIIGDTVFISTDEMTMVRQLKQHVSIDLNKVELAVALKQLARETATNIVLQPEGMKEAKTVVTLEMDDVPLETAVRLLAETAGLKVLRMANVLYVTPRAAANELRKTGAADWMQSNYEGTARAARHLKRLGGNVIVINEDVGIAIPDSLPLTEPLPPPPAEPAPKVGEKKD